MMLKQLQWRSLAVILVVLAVAACAVPLRNQLQMASEANRAYTERTIVLLEAKILTADEAAQRLTMIRRARDATRLAAVALDSCAKVGDTTCTPAATQLGMARALGEQIELELIKREKEKR